MRLLCMAHRGEAQQFISSLQLKAIDNRFYMSEELALLITGEGPFEVLTHLSYYFAKFGISEVINLGIAGALDDKLSLNQVYSVRTLYAYGNNEPRFHSYTSHDQHAVLDAITSENRVLSDEFALELSHYAHIVDREAWAMGKVCNEFKIPFYCYKLISDFAGAKTHCFDLKNQAKIFSQTMLDFYLAKVQIIEDKKKEKTTEEIILPFHCSFTHKKRIEKLLQLMQTPDLVKILTESNVEQLKLTDKEKAAYLIQYLEDTINPLQGHLKKELNKKVAPLIESGAQVYFDPKLEKKSFALKMEINSQANIENLKQALTNISFSDIEAHFDGVNNVQ